MKQRMVVAGIFFGLAFTSIAGTIFLLKCNNPKCGFEKELAVGGGFICDTITGYCTSCKDFVFITWRRPDVQQSMKESADKSGLKAEPPTKVGSVWNPRTGFTDLYPCPKCHKPFAPIDNATWLAVDGLTCPKCTNGHLNVRMIGNTD